MKSKLNSDPEYGDLEKKNDVVGLMKKLKNMAFMVDGVQYSYWTRMLMLNASVHFSRARTSHWETSTSD